MSLTLRNSTNYAATFIVRQDQQVIARLPSIAAGGQLVVPLVYTYQVTATTLIDGNTYTSAPIDVSGAMGFLAQVIQVASQGTYEFNVVEVPSRAPNQLQFQKTCLSPVTFTIMQDGVPLQTVVVSSLFEVVPIDIGNTYSITAAINGITTGPATTTNPNATVTAINDTSVSDLAYYTLVVS